MKGSAVNPVLREGNSDRRAAGAVKAYAKKHPHKMGKWSADSQSHVASMSGSDFYGNEKSMTVAEACTATIEFVGKDGTTKVLKDGLKLQAGEVVDATMMSAKALREYYEKVEAPALSYQPHLLLPPLPALRDLNSSLQQVSSPLLSSPLLSSPLLSSPLLSSPLFVSPERAIPTFLTSVPIFLHRFFQLLHPPSRGGNCRVTECFWQALLLTVRDVEKRGWAVVS